MTLRLTPDTPSSAPLQVLVPAVHFVSIYIDIDMDDSGLMTVTISPNWQQVLPGRIR